MGLQYRLLSASVKQQEAEKQLWRKANLPNIIQTACHFCPTITPSFISLTKHFSLCPFLILSKQNTKEKTNEDLT